MPEGTDNQNAEDGALSQLIAVTGLPEAAARSLLTGVNGNLAAAVDLFFSQEERGTSTPSSSPTTPIRRSNRRPLDPDFPSRCREAVGSLFDRVSQFLWIAVSSVWLLISGLVRPLSSSHLGLPFDASFRQLLLNPDEVTAPLISFSHSSLAQVIPNATSQLKLVCAFVVNSSALSSLHDLRRAVSQILTPDVQQLLSRETCLLGFDPKSSLSNGLQSRALQLDPNAPISITILLPLVLSVQRAVQLRRLLNPRESAIPDSSYQALPSHQESFLRDANPLTNAQLDDALMAMQSKLIALNDSQQLPSLGTFKLNILRHGCIQCYKLTLKPGDVLDNELLRSSLTKAINAGVALIQPLRDVREAERLRREVDRQLIAQQQREYEESLAADRARAQAKRESDERAKREEAERQRRLKEEAEEKTRHEQSLQKKAQAMLDATKEGPESPVFAEIVLQMAPRRERLRLRVAKDVKYKSLLEVISCVEYLVDAVETRIWVYPSGSEHGVACRRESSSSSSSQRSPHPPPPCGYLVTTAIGANKLDPEKTIEECQLLPNALLHVRITPDVAALQTAAAE
eukprot:Blabericola_migrator_1__69@NODE_1017_length_5686_cov_54_686777_g698_i0_p2_GENE_NODE_1017_length_5686_cov_54_686777_g698_i0NODE_1017_length_5686_cov_54_686777_g698_i0_p2_ORF_typecomplete_len573_score100_34UBA_4/PF14555_6/1_5e08GBP_C/PF02841_14/0_017UBX/PF00789_20/0_19SAGATad1/PF12767_7/0_21SFTA2/PF15210_6/8_6SFTA2/PF15210_6/1_1e02DUF572/PF04502_13/0_18DUF1682/PF07946_14/14DUF1682/PF07946_14/73VPS38/PF17649_1/0_92U79_P34/PF03064_16/1_1AAA_23/PF13476_6/1_9Borrelia_P83/PF05262_11/2_1SMC_N/PF02463_19